MGYTSINPANGKLISAFVSLTDLAVRFEQLESDLVLKVANLCAQRRLRDMELQRRAGKVFRLRGCYEVTQMPQFHSKDEYAFWFD